MGTILLIILILILIGSLPTWPYSGGWGYYPSGGVGYYPRSDFVHVDCGPVRTW